MLYIQRILIFSENIFLHLKSKMSLTLYFVKIRLNIQLLNYMRTYCFSIYYGSDVFRFCIIKYNAARHVGNDTAAAQ